MINVQKKEDGFWLEFDAASGTSALVSVDKLLSGSGPIVKKSILESCEEAAVQRTTSGYAAALSVLNLPNGTSFRAWCRERLNAALKAKNSPL